MTLARTKDERIEADFTSSSARYRYAPAATEDTTNRILVPVRVAGLDTLAVLDTGAPYSIVSFAGELFGEPDPSAALGSLAILFRGVTVEGTLHRLPLAFVADLGSGDDVEIEATFLVPGRRDRELFRNLPPFIGMIGALEAIRFAIDPSTDTFHFGLCP